MLLVESGTPMVEKS